MNEETPLWMRWFFRLWMYGFDATILVIGLVIFVLSPSQRVEATLAIVLGAVLFFLQRRAEIRTPFERERMKRLWRQSVDATRTQAVWAFAVLLAVLRGIIPRDEMFLSIGLILGPVLSAGSGYILADLTSRYVERKQRRGPPP